MNCLVTAIGSFSGAAVISSLKRNRVGKVVGCGIYPHTWVPGGRYLDAFYRVPIVYESKRYLRQMAEIIKSKRIDYIIPLTDPEVNLLSENRRAIEKRGPRICIPNGVAVSICRNKRAIHEFFKDDEQVKVIPTFGARGAKPGACGLPAIAKPQNGRSSEGVFIVNTKKELEVFRQRADYILQPLLTGSIFTVDCIRDKQNGISFAMPRKELVRTVNGAGMTVEVAPNGRLQAVARHVADRLDINGCINMEFIQHKGKYYLMDINPRFSAGVAFSILAGYDMVINHLYCFTGRKIQGPVRYQAMTMAKKLTEVIIKG